MRFLTRVLVTAAALWVAVRLVAGITYVGNPVWLVAVAIVFGAVNAFMKPLLFLLSLPLVVLTLGFFTLVVNAFLLWMTSALAGVLGLGFHVTGFWAAFVGALVVSIVSMILDALIRDPARIAAVLVLAAPFRSASAQTSPGEFLQTAIGLNANQVRSVDRGSAVVRTFATKSDRDVVLFGVILIDVPRSFYVDRALAFDPALRPSGRTGFGIFSTPARPSDIDTIRVSSDDIDALRSCRPGSCEFKLPATDMERLRAMLGSPGGGRDQLAAYARQRMTEYVNDYRARGNDAMIVYDDASRGGVHSSDAFADLLARSPYLFEYLPAFHQYLLSYPRQTLSGARDVIYWAHDESQGLRPTFTINHMSVYSPPEQPGVTVIGTKQLFADHYFEAGLDLIAALEQANPAGGSMTYVLLLRQYRFDNLPSGALLNIRGRVVSRLSDLVQAELLRAKRGIETAYQTQPGR